MTKTKSTSATSVRKEEHVEEIVSSIGPKVKALRQEQRLSLQQLAVKAEVSAAAIHKIERNDMVPTITTLLKVASALDRPVTYFVEPAGSATPWAAVPTCELCVPAMIWHSASQDGAPPPTTSVGLFDRPRTVPPFSPHMRV